MRCRITGELFSQCYSPRRIRLGKETCRDFVKAGAVKGLTPADVVAASDITFCCVSNSHAAKEMVFGNCGVLHEIKDNKGYVEMTSIDPDTSQDISEAIMLRGGRYLEAPVSGSKKPAEDGTLIILAAGDRSLFNDCASCFEAIGRHAFYLGEVGNGSKMSLILNMLLGTTLAGLAEAMALCDRAELSQKDLLEILELGDLNSAVISQKGQGKIDAWLAPPGGETTVVIFLVLKPPGASTHASWGMRCQRG
ncbi:hypothetical protein HPB51_024866 [Rhipicephalus microplus]|uniref:6-phosphogluconate dehydrogenase NADP-binding domain-containing protein n=1 Tax=Rhipicephalus microplus TaxID=6941 RepID=A0A9J6F6F9_RHIMP|nr:hypothetical protein HPB51_024866 [Rhipicephalus microplus]